MKVFLLSILIALSLHNLVQNAVYEEEQPTIDISLKPPVYTDRRLLRHLSKRAIVTNSTLCHCTGGFSSDCDEKAFCVSDCNGRIRDAHEVDCVFPFKYKDKWYDTCTNVDRGSQFWCSVDQVYNGRYAPCQSECSLKARILAGSGNNHSSCLKIADGWVEYYPTDAEIKLILDTHNLYRSNVTPSATNLKALTWDHGLARLALRLSAAGNFNHDCGGCRRLVNNGSVSTGQNLFAAWGMSYSSTYWSSAIGAWYSEIKYFKYGNGSTTGYWGDIGHFTQVVNADAYRVGCAMAMKGTSSIAACNYAYAQYNVNSPYKNGVSCSECTPGMCVNNLCTCNKICQNYGTLDMSTCTCKCQPYATGPECEIKLCNQTDASYGCWGNDPIYCRYSNTQPLCPHMCGVCDYFYKQTFYFF